MTLKEYARKRRFDRTREPGVESGARASGRPIFVVQLHHASHRHYDFRLQVGDTLRSWAVPKGPSFDPSVKRLAAEVEDHPVDYAAFEGEIPAGEYGGGHVARFDGGVWSTTGDAAEQLKKGHLRFELFGDKLKGGWYLIRSGRPSSKPQWLLIKDKDQHARDAEADDLLSDVSPPSAAAIASTRIAPKKRVSTKSISTESVSTKSVSTKNTKKPSASTARTRKVSASTRAIVAGEWLKKAAAIAAAEQRPVPVDPPTLQLATAASAPPKGGDWVHEIKWDGYRIQIMVADGRARLWSRNGIEWTAKLPDIVDAIEQLGLRDAVIDGELIAGRGGRADFPLLQSTLSGDRHAPLVYVAFDLLHVDGVSLTQVALTQRKALLAAVFSAAGNHLALSTHSPGDGDVAFAAAVGQGFEGIVSKRGDAPHRAGRGKDWLKMRTLDSEEFAVVGYTPPKGSRDGFGSLLLARREAASWAYAGKVGTGFSDALLKDLRRRIGNAGAAAPSVRVPPNDTDLRGAKWFEPRFVVEVASRGVGTNGLLRQPSLKAVRLDKTIADLPASVAITSKTAAQTRMRTKPDPRSANTPASKPGAQRMKTKATDTNISSPTKVLFPDSGLTKQDVADYYMAVMPRLLPEIVERPLSVIRCPGGIEGSCFFQKHHSAGIEGVDVVPIEEKDGDTGEYLIVRDAAAVMALVQANTLEFHPWGAKAGDPDRADRLVFDLDPGPDVAWSEVRAAARLIRELLAVIDIECFLRTSGGKGLHVVVPLQPAVPWDIAKPFAHAFAESMARLHPDRFVASSTKSRRIGRIFVDYLRNGRGATSVASYSLRARPGAPVAMPITWQELSRVGSGDAFKMGASLLRRLARRTDPWEGIDAIRQGLPTIAGGVSRKNGSPRTGAPTKSTAKKKPLS